MLILYFNYCVIFKRLAFRLGSLVEKMKYSASLLFCSQHYLLLEDSCKRKTVKRILLEAESRSEHGVATDQ